MITKEKTELKLSEIIPHPSPFKRLLFKAAEFMFKAVTENFFSWRTLLMKEKTHSFFKNY